MFTNLARLDGTFMKYPATVKSLPISSVANLYRLARNITSAGWFPCNTFTHENLDNILIFFLVNEGRLL